MDGLLITEQPRVQPVERCSADSESRSGITPLVAACYRLDLANVVQLLNSGADPNRLASFGGGVSPTLATLLAIADAFDAGRPQIQLLGDAQCAIQIWAKLCERGASCNFPPNILVSRSVMRLLQDAAARENQTFLLVTLVRIEERMHTEHR